MLLLGKPQQPSAQQWSLSKDERRSGFQSGEPAQLFLSFLLRHVAEIDHGQRDSEARRRDLDRDPLHIGDAAAKDLVALYYAVESLVQGAAIEGTGDSKSARNVVEWASGVQPIEKPLPLLRKGQGCRAIAAPPGDGPGPDPGAPPQQSTLELSPVCYRETGKEGAEVIGRLATSASGVLSLGHG